MGESEPATEVMSCPFCDFECDGDYQIMLHMETLHPENGESPFIAHDDASVAAIMSLQDEEDIQYVQCPVEGCGEALLLTELDMHVQMHEVEQGGASGDPDDSEPSRPSSKRVKIDPQVKESFDTKLSHALRTLGDDDDDEHVVHEKIVQDAQTAAKEVWKNILKMPHRRGSPRPKGTKNGKKRLGRAELGPYWHEKEMPPWLVSLLLKEDGAMKTGKTYLPPWQRGAKMVDFQYCPNQTDGIVPVLSQLLEQDSAVSYAYMCDPAVKHVSKLKREGGFCGYRNIQALCSYIIGTKSRGWDLLNKVPSVFEIQDWIEYAWDSGINAHARIETGGVRGTRKYIGTPEAQAMFCAIGIAAQTVKPKPDSTQPAYELLFAAVESYFVKGCKDYYDPKVRCTNLPPIYLQQPGHSMTIVGFQKKNDGTRNLIVFDPMFQDPPSVVRHIGHTFKQKLPGLMLDPYLRGEKYLKRYKLFELLTLVPTERNQPPFIDYKPEQENQ